MKERVSNEMNELIKITINEEGQQLVSARELHEFLEVKTRFNDWIVRMCEYGFKENIDYSILSNDNPNGGLPIKEYAITIDMAKEISMIQRTDKGKQARQYFIACEKKLREEIQNKEITPADTINKLISGIPEDERTEAMLKLVDRFYPIGNNESVKEKKKEKKTNKYKLTLDKVITIFKETYDNAFMATRSNYIVFDKDIIYKYFAYRGIGKRILNSFLLTNNLVKTEGNGVNATCTCNINGKKVKALYVKAEYFIS